MKKKSKTYDAILLLGYELDVEDAPTEELRVRVKTAVQAYRAGKAPTIVASGGTTRGHRVSEACVMTQLLEEEGVPSTAVLREDKSQVTMDNALFSLRLLSKLYPHKKKLRVLVVTSDYHLRRAVWTARRAGFRADGYGAVLTHDETWQAKKREEWAYTLDLVMGWQDPGRSRPAWTYTLFGRVFEKKS